MRLIDADALMQTYAKFVAPSNNSDFENEPTWNDAVSLLESAPTVDAVPLEDYKSMERTVNKLTKAIADAEPVKHGHWIAHGKAFMGATIEACSECGELLCGYNKAYCPNCGAKMDEVTE